MLLLFALYSQSTTNDDVSSSRVLEQQLLLQTEDTPITQETTTSGNTIWLFIRMILVLILVIACIYGVVWLLKKGSNFKQTQDPYLKKTASVTLAPGKTVQVVTIGDKAYVVGVSDTGINLIGELTDKELIDAMNIHASEEPTGTRKDFSSMLKAFSKSTEATESYLRSRREKLQKSEDDK